VRRARALIHTRGRQKIRGRNRDRQGAQRAEVNDPDRAPFTDRRATSNRAADLAAAVALADNPPARVLHAAGPRGNRAALGEASRRAARRRGGGFEISRRERHHPPPHHPRHAAASSTRCCGRVRLRPGPRRWHYPLEGGPRGAPLCSCEKGSMKWIASCSARSSTVGAGRSASTPLPRDQ